MAFTFGYSPWLLLLCVAVAGGLTYWSYRITVPPLGAGWRGLLGGLRFLALTPVLAVLVDDSESMRVVTAGNQSPSVATARDSVRPILETLGDDEVSGSVRFFGAGSALRALPGPTADSLRFDGARTDLASALQGVPEELQGTNLQGIVLVSDGQYNTGRNPLRVADRSPVPIHTVTVGDTTRSRDLRLRSVATNDRAYLDSRVPVRATLTATDGRGESVTVTLEQDGQTLDRGTVRLPTGTGEASIDLTFEPTAAGLQQLTVRASELPGEVTTRNNVQTVSLRVLESKRQVLLLGAAPSPNVTAVRRVYERDADTEVTARIPQPDGSFIGGPLPDDLSTFDVVVAAGFPSDPVPTDVVERIAMLIEDDGTPALFFLDRQTDLAAWRQHFESVLPATPSRATTDFVESPFTVAQKGRQHPVFRIEDADVALFERLPPLQRSAVDWTPTLDARVLATAPPSSGSDAAPLLVVRSRAGLRTGAFLGTGVWRWALLPSQLEPADPLWPGLASNLLRWVSTEADDSPVRVRPVSSTFDGDEPVSFTGQVYPYTMDPVGQGRYTLDVGTLPEGSYRYDAVARLEGTELGTDQGKFSVAPLRLEYQTPRSDAVLMQQVAARSGGTAYTPQTVQQLPRDLDRRSSFSSEVVRQTSEAELWRTSLFLLAILVLLASEWTLRKYLGLT
ncbi:MAG: hypothetical protein BRD26_00635 [Bacteroidetes bacterium QH_1_64_81]|nr:MAG: hypothetical protein BRD26_00635 [Bacteroidetes bacterium QH_1_64_81]